ncbi:hypothetical protein QR77_18395 [Streptomyces sp. 150FB]|uniref:hypothetical protein n=1 Tax=Streptomyces sp. 150FB TaxID=1576605 RepID=UPI0005892A56|nr:hypothetical protein [Streptomyces sp. 150FB]KIF75350.1 hypothetical protein QR77_18395 [Streptomyces sp. 150FB]
MQTQAGNAATAAFLSGAAPVQRAPLTVQRVDGKGKRRERSPLTEEELRREEEYQRALARQARAHERARARAAEDDLPMGSMDDPFGGHTNKKGYKGDRGPLAVTNKVRHPGSSKFSERYYEDRPGKPSGFMSHLTDDDIGVSLDVLGNIPPDQDAIDRMDATRRRASSTLYGAASSEEQRHPGASKAMRSALRRQKSGKTLRKDFKDDFPMAGSSKYDGPAYGAQAFSKAQSGKTRLSRGAQETLLDMSDSSDDGRGRRPSREPEIVEAPRPRHRSMSAGPSSYSGRPEPAGPSSRHYPPSSSRVGQIPGGSSQQPIIMTAEPPRERRRSLSRPGHSSSRQPQNALPLRPAPAPYQQNPYPPAPMPYRQAPPAPMPYRQNPYPPAPAPYQQNPYPPAPMPYRQGPPAPMPYRQSSYGAPPPPRSEAVHMINGRPCVLRDGRWVAIG